MENLGARGISIYDNETLTLGQAITDESQFIVSVPNSGVGTMTRFPLGSYIQVDSEIMRVADSCLLYTSPSPRDVEESRMPSSA